LPLALTTIPENSGTMNFISKPVPVRKAQAAFALQVFTVGNITGFAHEIAAIATCSLAGDGCKERRIVNRQVDLATWNDVYNE
jgi:hypothetical protein